MPFLRKVWYNETTTWTGGNHMKRLLSFAVSAVLCLDVYKRQLLGCAEHQAVADAVQAKQ